MKKVIALCSILALAAVAYGSQLTSATVIPFEAETSVNTLPVAASNTVYRGSAVGSTNGYVKQLVAGDTFKGFAMETKDNSTGADGDLTISVRHRGIAQLAVTSVAVTDEGKAVYASDGATFTLTQGSNSRIGTVHRYVSSGVAMVKFDADGARDLTSVSTLAGTLTGTVTGTNANVADVTTNTVPAINALATNVNLQLKELQTKLNEVINAQK